jgi:hypothetical protein
MQETFHWEMKTVSPDRQDPREQAYRDWWESYVRHLKGFQGFIKGLRETLRQREVLDESELVEILCTKLRRQLKQHPLQHFCYVAEQIESCEEELLKEDYLATLLFWMLLDYRLSWLRCDCPSCDPQTGVPVARVWLQIPDYRQNRKCRVLLVMDWQPYRRPIQPDVCLPACSDGVNMEQFLWKRPEDIESKYTFDYPEFPYPKDISKLNSWLDGFIESQACVSLAPNQAVPLFTVPGPGNNGNHVVSFING